MDVKDGLKKLKQDILLNDIICLDDFIIQNKITENNIKKEFISISKFKQYVCEDLNLKKYKVYSYSDFAKNGENNSESDKKNLYNIKVNKFFLLKKDTSVKFIVDLFGFFESFLRENTNSSLQKVIDNKTKNEEIRNKTFTDFENKMKRYFYRGHDSMNYSVLPSIYRNDSYIKNENKMYYDLMSEYSSNFSNSRRHIDILRKFQHYGMPTRLLDITSNLLVAMLFSTSKNFNYDSELIMLESTENVKNNYSDTIEILTALSTQNYKQKEELYLKTKEYNKEMKNITNENKIEEKIDEYNREKPIQLLLHEIRRMVGHFEQIIDPRDLFNSFLARPLLDNPRIIRQSGAFIVTGLYLLEENYKEQIINSINKYRYKNKENKTVRYIIPSVYKEKFRANLSVLGINEKSLFPELSTGAKFIKNQYNLDV